PQTVFNIWIVGNDEKVVSTLHENADNLLRKGVIKVIGLRDLYSQRYEDRLKRKNKFPLKVYHDVNREFIDNATLQLRKSQKIKLLFSIMEIETWILSFTNIFPKINRDLLPIQIKEKTGYDLINDNLEEYYRPSHILNEILKLIGKTYHKKISEILMLTSHISPEDINNSESFVASFGLFMDEIKQIDRNSLSMR
ncbi:MAG TPA: hypothetical protein VK338_03510, partial [Candidatus Nitrosocosmicus sp.]|nr:hypothetical protein [Candidatus Nitrosocosmicus sp.]